MQTNIAEKDSFTDKKIRSSPEVHLVHIGTLNYLNFAEGLVEMHIVYSNLN